MATLQLETFKFYQSKMGEIVLICIEQNRDAGEGIEFLGSNGKHYNSWGQYLADTPSFGDGHHDLVHELTTEEKADLDKRANRIVMTWAVGAAALVVAAVGLTLYLRSK